jgi:hypothetical protein
LRRCLLHYDLHRAAGSLSLDISADRPLGTVAFRLGPFTSQAEAARARINGKPLEKLAVEQSGDSWWVWSNAAVGPASATAKR